MSHESIDKPNDYYSDQDITLSQTLKKFDQKLLGERLRQARVSLHLFQSDIARGLFTSAYLSSLELGKVRPTYKSLKLLAERLNKSVEYFLYPALFQDNATTNTWSFDQEQVFRNRLELNHIKVLLAKKDLGAAHRSLEELRRKQARLSLNEQIEYHLEQTTLFNLLHEGEKAIIELNSIVPLVAAQKKSQTVSTELLARIDLEYSQAYYSLQNFVKALNHSQAGMSWGTLNDLSLEGKLQLQTVHCFLAMKDAVSAAAILRPLMNYDSETSEPNKGIIYYWQSGREDWLQGALLLGRSKQIWSSSNEIKLRINFHFEYAWFLFETKKYENALEVALQAFHQLSGWDEESHLEIQVLLARIENRLKHKTAAMAWLNKVSSHLFSGNSEVKKVNILFQYERAAGEIAGDGGQFEAALEHYQEAVRYYQLCNLDPNQPGQLINDISKTDLGGIYFELGQQLHGLGRLEEALNYIDQANSLY